MEKHQKAEDRVTVGAAVVMGIIMSFASVGFFSTIALIWTWISESFAEAVAAFAVVCLVSCPVLLFFPIMGLCVSLSNKSWYALKLWTASTTVSILINVTAGGAALLLGSWLQN